jgi:hypothetical protein
VDQGLRRGAAPVEGKVRKRLRGSPRRWRFANPAAHEVRSGKVPLVGTPRGQQDRLRVEPAGQVALPTADQPSPAECRSHCHQLGAPQRFSPFPHRRTRRVGHGHLGKSTFIFGAAPPRAAYTIFARVCRGRRERLGMRFSPIFPERSDGLGMSSFAALRMTLAREQRAKVTLCALRSRPPGRSGRGGSGPSPEAASAFPPRPWRRKGR